MPDRGARETAGSGDRAELFDRVRQDRGKRLYRIGHPKRILNRR